jgi:hypothetical protein
LATLGKVPGPTAGLVLLFCMNFADNANTLIRQQVGWVVHTRRACDIQKQKQNQHKSSG